MRRSNLLTIALLGLLLAAIPASARTSFGIGFGNYGPYNSFYSPYWYGGGYYGPWGYPYVGPSTYRSPQIRPSSGVPMIAGATNYIDEGDYRNYRDDNDTYLGRYPLGSIPAGLW